MGRLRRTDEPQVGTRLLVKPAHEAGDCLYLAVAQVSDGATHHPFGVIGTLVARQVVPGCATERLQLRRDVIGMLSSQRREGARSVAAAGRAMATATGRHARLEVAAAPEGLARLDQGRIRRL